MWSLKLLTAPTVEPVSVDEAKQYARIDTSADDMLVDDLIRSARSMLEQQLSRQFCSATWQLTLDSFRTSYDGQWYDAFRVPNPAQMMGASPFGNVIYPFLTLQLPRPPLQSVTSLTYYDTAGTLQALVQGTLGGGTGDYLADTNSEPGRITPQWGTVWPWARAAINAVTLTYVAGHAYNPLTPGTPPEPVWWRVIRTAIMVTVAHWYADRESVDVLPKRVEALLFAADYGRAA